jgi:hypothetical protein
VCRYNQIDKHLENWATQWVINVELKFGLLDVYEMVFNEKQATYEKTEVTSLVFLGCAFAWHWFNPIPYVCQTCM